MYYNTKEIINRIACKKADESWRIDHDKSRADKLYFSTKNYLWKQARFMASSSDMRTATDFIVNWYSKELGIPEPKPATKPARKPVLEPGPEMFVVSVRDDLRILKDKVKKYLSGKISRKAVADAAYIMLGVCPEFYKEERHGKFMSKSEFDSIMNFARKWA